MQGINIRRALANQHAESRSERPCDHDESNVSQAGSVSRAGCFEQSGALNYRSSDPSGTGIPAHPKAVTLSTVMGTPG
jgi:hypothetical protein